MKRYQKLRYIKKINWINYIIVNWIEDLFLTEAIAID